MPLPLTSQETIAFPFKSHTYVTINMETVIRLHLQNCSTSYIAPVALYVFTKNDSSGHTVVLITDGNQILQALQNGDSFCVKCSTKSLQNN